VLPIRKDSVIPDDKRWMIRGVDRRVRKAIKDAAKAEGTSVGTWVLRALQRSLETAEGAPATVEGLKERMRLVEARMEVLEKSHRRLHQKVQAANHRIEKPQAKM
jgi:hypothetical protein